ncbi:MAG: acylphosphatase [Firmicutes bacterium]|nr:acylphosphatase [Bacillota bacterium]
MINLTSSLETLNLLKAGEFKLGLLNILSSIMPFLDETVTEGLVRPFLYNLARAKGITGWVRKNFAGAEL